MKVYLKYSFILEPIEEWRSRDDFDVDLMKHFQSKGFQSEIIKTALEDAADIERMVYLTKITEVPVGDPPPPVKTEPVDIPQQSSRAMRTPRQIINQLLIKKRDESGKFQKEK